MDLSLGEYLKKIKYKDREKKIIIKNIIQGVSYLHNRDIVHHDLKPENILLKIDINQKITKLKIADFGLVMENRLVMDGELGTRTYMPPIYEKSINKKYDIYSLGIIFFELWNDFYTQMERSKAILQFKKGDFNIKNDNIIYIKKMINDNENLRPEINEIKINLLTT